MPSELSGKKVAFLVANAGVEQVELTSPWQAVLDAGGEPVLVAPAVGPVQAYKYLDKGEVFEATVPTSALAVDGYDIVVLPGGIANPDRLRIDEPAVAFLREWTRAGKPLAAICHGPWPLIDADAVRGKTLTSWVSLRADIRNAGGEWRDAESVRCDAPPYPLVTSRKPADLDAFNAALVTILMPAAAASSS
jgi:protease I